MRYILLISLFTFILSHALAQTISSEDYEKQFIFENFNNSKSTSFTQERNIANHISIDNNNLFIVRKKNDSPYLLLTKHNEIGSFVLKTKLRLGPTNNKKASVGIILKAKQNGEGAIIFEINKKGEYRIRSFVNNSYHTLSGKEKHNGWVKNKVINKVDEHNIIEIRTNNNIYDIYANNSFLTSFTSVNNKEGKCGLFINSNSKARVVYFYINTKETTEDESIKTKDSNLPNQILALEKENDHLKSIIKINSENIYSDEKDIVNTKMTDLNNRINLLSKQLKIANSNNTTLQTTNTELKELLIQKEFELNGVETSEIVKQTSNTTPAKLKGNKIIYTVQIGVYMKEQTNKSTKDIDDVWSNATEHGTYVYYSGEFNSPLEAVIHQNNLITKGYNNAFVVTLRK